jgi:DNA helicase-2/ATP-dependent DNA helicase PcrA
MPSTMRPPFDPTKLVVGEADLYMLNDLFGFTFNKGQVDFLRHWKTADIQACPGSGKTTTLAAKLILLAQKVPPGYQKGVCVITHTNTAVDEIKGKLGDYTGFYNRYPNHFGTIQSFVDKYLMLPAYRGLFHRTPTLMDTETYHKLLVRHPLIRYKTVPVLDNYNIYAGSLSFNKFDFTVSKSLNDPKPLDIPRLTRPVMKKHFDLITCAKEEMLADGYLKYDEAYAIAFRYLREHPEIRKAIAKRFPFVFIDERQDMENHQTEIITSLFDVPQVVLQQVGDKNQAIYGHPDSKDVAAWQPKTQSAVQLTMSNRLPDHIAKLISPVCAYPQLMTGTTPVKAIKPVIFVYDDASLPFVVDAFARLVLHHQLENKGHCKCIGFRNSEAKLNLQSYWPAYNRKKVKTEFQHLVSYCHDLEQVFQHHKNIARFKKLLLEAICRGLKIGGVNHPHTQKYFTPASLNTFYQESGKLEGFHTRVGCWIRQVQKGESIFISLSAFMNVLLKHFKAKESDDLREFLENTAIEIKADTPDQIVYTYRDQTRSVDLQFDTVHGVKGETHVATLYMETYYILNDLGDKILPFIAADERQQGKYRKDNAFLKRLPCAYVAMSRATDLLTLAVHVKRFPDDLGTYFSDEESGWNVVYLCPHD